MNEVSQPTVSGFLVFLDMTGQREYSILELEQKSSQEDGFHIEYASISWRASKQEIRLGECKESSSVWDDKLHFTETERHA